MTVAHDVVYVASSSGAERSAGGGAGDVEEGESLILPGGRSRPVRRGPGAPAAPFSGLLGSIATTKLTGSAGAAANGSHIAAVRFPAVNWSPHEDALRNELPVKLAS